MTWLEDLRGGASYLAGSRRRIVNHDDATDLTAPQLAQVLKHMETAINEAGLAIDVLIAAGAWPYNRDAGLTGTSVGSPAPAARRVQATAPKKSTPATPSAAPFDAAHPWRK